MAGATEPAAQNTTTPETFDVIVVGAGAAGLSAAITAAASGLKTVIIEKSPYSLSVYHGMPRPPLGRKKPPSAAFQVSPPGPACGRP